MHHAISIDDRDNDTRLYLGPARNAALLEVVTVHGGDRVQTAIHAMGLRPKYRRLLLGE